MDIVTAIATLLATLIIVGLAVTMYLDVPLRSRRVGGRNAATPLARRRHD